MIVYLAQKYFIYSVVFFAGLVILPLGFFDNTEYVIVRGFVSGGIFGGILLTDHMHRYISVVADKGYLLHNKQCYDLKGNFTTELKKMDYLR